MNRFADRPVVINDDDIYRQFLKRKNVPFVRQFVSPVLKFPTADQIAELSLIDHTWSVGDRYWKIAASAYGDPNVWWIIAWFNQKPTEAHVKLGDVIQIPHPIDKVKVFFGV